MTTNNQYAIFLEYAKNESVPVDAGPNLRIFNDIEIPPHVDGIKYDGEGTIVVRPGCYRISATSIVTYLYDESAATVITKEFSNAGYCSLIEKGAVVTGPDDAENALAMGTVSHASAMPSIIETILNFEDETELQLIHQAGRENLENIYLQAADGISKTRLFARLVITQLE